MGSGSTETQLDIPFFPFVHNVPFSLDDRFLLFLLDTRVAQFGVPPELDLGFK